MSARDTLVGIIAQWSEQHGAAAQTPGALVDAYRAEVLAKAIGRLRAIPVTCTALTGPVWYGDGWNSAITCLEDIANYQQPDDEEYPGELQRLRATILALRVTVLRKEDLTEAQRVLNDHEDWRKKATAAAATATPDFFQPGHTYADSGSEYDWKFRCDVVTTHPEDGERTALGWRYFNGQWSEIAYGEDDWEIHGLVGTTDVTGAGDGP